MAAFDPPFTPYPLNVHTAEPCKPYAQRPGRWDVYDLGNKLLSEDLEAFRMRARLAADAWWLEDVKAAEPSPEKPAPKPRGWPPADAMPGETPAQRKARRNREAQERHRDKKAGVYRLTLAQVIAVMDLARSLELAATGLATSEAEALAAIAQVQAAP